MNIVGAVTAARESPVLFITVVVLRFDIWERPPYATLEIHRGLSEALLQNHSLLQNNLQALHLALFLHECGNETPCSPPAMCASAAFGEPLGAIKL